MRLAQAAPFRWTTKKPVKSEEKRKYDYLKMCKSQNRKEIDSRSAAFMLMDNELHNWLLFMALTLPGRRFGNRPIGPCQKKPQTRFSIPQAFPQGQTLLSLSLQTQLPKGLTEAPLGCSL
jgi:hypothetical protein